MKSDDMFCQIANTVCICIYFIGFNQEQRTYHRYRLVETAGLLGKKLALTGLDL